MLRKLPILFLLCLLPATVWGEEEPEDGRVVKLIEFEGTIGPTTTDYLERAMQISVEEGAEALIIRMDTPGGLLVSTQDIVRLILDSDIPIVVYVAPEGAGAGSAGVFITLSAHVAAMAPATNIGAATPVQMGGGDFDDDVEDEEDEDLSTQERKMINFVESYIEGIAERRGRNAEWAKEAVRDASTIGSSEALEINVIDLIADDLDELLEKMDGREVDDFVLNTSGATVEEIPMSMRESALRFLFNPQVMLILLLVALYGIIGELGNPGAIIPGTLGVIALLLLLYATAAMPVNILGYVLIGLAVILMIIEVFTPTFGLLTAGGVFSFILGAFMLFEEFSPGDWQAWAYILPAAILTAILISLIVSAGIRAQFGKTRMGTEAYVGQKAEVVQKVTPTGGKVLYMGEYWNAESDSIIKEGEPCEITGTQGLKLMVKPLNKED